MIIVMQGEISQALSGALVTAQRAPEIAETDDIYGGLIGSWDLRVRHYRPNPSLVNTRGEAHFARVLEGRAIQDVWIVPSVVESPTMNPGRFYGTTIRMWDTACHGWRITWINPVSGRRNELLGRRSGKDIVQIGTHPDGTPIRWIFSEILPESFRWTGEALQPNGSTWVLESEYFATRRQAQKG